MRKDILTGTKPQMLNPLGMMAMTGCRPRKFWPSFATGQACMDGHTVLGDTSKCFLSFNKINQFSCRNDRPLSHTLGWSIVVCISFVSVGYLMMVNIEVSLII